MAPSSTSGVAPSSSSVGISSSSGYAVPSSSMVITSSAPLPSSSGGPYGTLDPSGTEASSRADEIRTSIDGIIPIIQSYTRDPDPPGATAVIEAIEDIKPAIDNFVKDLNPTDQEEGDCSGGNLIESLFAIVKCAVDELENTIDGVETEIENNFEDMTITDTVGPILSNISNSLEDNNNDNDDDDDDDDDDQSTTQSSATQSSTASSYSQSSSGSCEATTITTSVCDTICVTPTPASSLSAYPSDASLTTQSCTTTCPETTITGCSFSVDQPESTTSTVTITGDSCPLTSAPAGPYVTAWFDDSVSCAGSGCGGLDVIPSIPNYSVSMPAPASSSFLPSASSNPYSSLPASTSMPYGSSSSAYPSATSSQGSSLITSYISSEPLPSSFSSRLIEPPSWDGVPDPVPISSSYFYYSSYFSGPYYYSSVPYYSSYPYSALPTVSDNPGTPSSAAPEPSSSYDPENPDCIECGTNLGASTCSADDNQCLVDQCYADSACTACGINCGQYADL
jgi:hypothetical protein